MPFLTRFDMPGGLRDLPPTHPRYEEWLATWHTVVNEMIGAGPFNGSAGPEPSPDTPVGKFYNPVVTDVNTIGERSVVWMGFPRKVMIENRDNRRHAFEIADTRGDTPEGKSTQQEYLEWHVARDKETEKIRKVTLVTETREYWEELFKIDADRVLQLYRRLVSPLVQMEHLVTGTAYNPLNRWNTRDGIVHYIVENLPNTLDAAIGLARGSVNSPIPPPAGSVRRHPRDNYEIAGGAMTSADPRVGVDINMLVRKGLSITLREPVGLYMAAWDDTGWTKPDGSPVGNYWRVVRGRVGAALRLEYEVPAREGFLVGDIRIGGRPIKYGGHLAEHVTVMIGGLAGTDAV